MATKDFSAKPAGKHKRPAYVSIEREGKTVVIDRRSDGFGCAEYTVDGDSLIGGKPHVEGIGAGLGLEPSQWAEIQREAIRGG